VIAGTLAVAIIASWLRPRAEIHGPKQHDQDRIDSKAAMI
jgi:hypothetical protein